MQIYSKNNKNCFFSLISWPILIWFALSGRAKFGTLNFYTEFWDFAPLIIYGTLCKWNEIMSLPGHQIFIFWPVQKCTTIFVVARCGWALRHWRSGLSYWIALCRRDRRERFPCYFFGALLDHFEARFFLGLKYYTISQTLVTCRTVYLRFNIVKRSL